MSEFDRPERSTPEQSGRKPTRTSPPREGLRLLFGTAASLLAACTISQTAEVPIVNPDLLVAFKDGTYRNIPNRMPEGDELELQTTCPTGTTFFWANEISRYYQKRPDNVEPRGAYLASGVYNNDGSLKWFHLSYHPTTPSTFEGNVVLDCEDALGLIVTIMGKYQIVAIPNLNSIS